MTAQQLREKYLKFFKSKGHRIISSASLIPSDEQQLEGKEKVLFTSAGMQPLIPYLMGKVHPDGKRLVNVQKCLRTDDIEEVGDTTHNTFFEMLGNWSLGDYWKEEAIEYSFEFLTEELQLPVEKLAVSVFAGDEDAPKDEVSANKWKSLGITEERVVYLGKEANWWPTNSSALGPCGPDTEMFYWVGKTKAPQIFDPKDCNWVEIWNDVFMEFNRKEDGSLEELPQKNVDTGMGLERTLAILSGKTNNYETELFLPIIAEIKKSGNDYSEKSQRIIADHLRAAIFLLAAGVSSDPKDSRGSVVRRLITNALFQESKLLGLNIVLSIVDIFVKSYSQQYLELKEKEGFIKEQLRKDSVLLEKIKNGSEIEKMVEEFKGKDPKQAGVIGYFYHQSHGIPESIILSEAYHVITDYNLFLDSYKQEFKKHQQASKVERGVFKGGLAGHSEIEIKYHTATHLLHQALRDVLGPQVFQKGSNINPERLRFDFSFDRKLTSEEIKQVEDIVNKVIKEDLKVDKKLMTVKEAKSLGAIGLFEEKYGSEASIYLIGPGYSLDPNTKDQRERSGYYSVEFCGGPHVVTTGVIGSVKITKEEAVSAGVRRIRVELSK